MKTGSKEAAKTYRELQNLSEHLQQGKTALSWPNANNLSDLNLLTAKPVIYVANISYEKPTTEQDLFVQVVKEYAQAHSAQVIVLDAELEAELSEIEDPEVYQELRNSYKIVEPGLEKVVKAAYEQLNLITFYTIIGSECKAWLVTKGTTAQEAAAKIHSDIAKGFIKAEVIHFPDLVKYKTLAKLKEAGLIRLEGRNYQLQDGDILTVKFH